MLIITALYATRPGTIDSTGIMAIQLFPNQFLNHFFQTQCDLFGFQSIEGDIVILIKAMTEKPTTLQVGRYVIAGCKLLKNATL